MGSDLTNNIQIEFYGLPGCGKSTVSEIVAEELELKGFRVVHASYEIGDQVPKVKRIFIKLWRTFVYSVTRPAKVSKIKSVVKQSGGKGFKHVNNIIQKFHYYDRGGRKIYIWDQGLVQASVSLSLEGDRKACDILDDLMKITDRKDKTVNIYMAEPVQTVIERMEMRSTNNATAEKIKDDDLKRKYLGRFGTACDSVRADIRIEGAGRNPKQISEEIMERLKSFV